MSELRLAIAAPVRCEASYLLEWIAYHRALGITRFLLADNGGDDGTSALLQRLHQHRLIERLDWLGKRYFQLAFYAQALRLAHGHVDGMFFIDVDEFLRPACDTASLPAIAESWLGDAAVGAVALNWAVYGSSGAQAREPGLVIERFGRRAPQELALNRHTKALVHVARCQAPGDNPHAFRLHTGRYINARGEDVVWDTSSGAPHGISSSVVWDPLRVDHFVLKSRAEFERKRARGSAMSDITEGSRNRRKLFRRARP